MIRRALTRECERLAHHVLSDYRMSREARAQEVTSLGAQLETVVALYLDTLGLELER